MVHRLRSMGRAARLRVARPARVGLAAAIVAGAVLSTLSVDSAAFASGSWSAPTLIDSGGGLTSVSCPNVKTGLDIGADPRQLEEVVRAVRPRTGKPLIVKLTPNAADVAACAQAAQAGGADAVSLINTLRALALAPASRGDLSTARSPEPWLGGRTGGLSGPAIRAVALVQVAAVAARVEIPTIGMGGVSSTAHARELLDVGARLVAVVGRLEASRRRRR